MSFFKDVSISGAGADLWTYLKRPRQHNWLLWILAFTPAGLIMYMFQLDSTNKAHLPPPQVTYFESWPADRSIEEIKRDQIIRQAEKEEREEERKKGLRALGRAIGMDVEKIEQDAEAARAQQENKKAQSADAQTSAAKGAQK